MAATDGAASWRSQDREQRRETVMRSRVVNVVKRLEEKGRLNTQAEYSELVKASNGPGVSQVSQGRDNQ
jgi:hypothetical protein